MSFDIGGGAGDGANRSMRAMDACGSEVLRDAVQTLLEAGGCGGVLGLLLRILRGVTQGLLVPRCALG